MLFIANYQYISSMRAVRKKHFSNDEKRAAIELWRAKIPLKDIRKQLEMSESTLRRILAFAKASPSYPIRLRKPVTGRKCKVLPAMKRAMKTKIEANPTITAKQLKKALKKNIFFPIYQTINSFFFQCGQYSRRRLYILHIIQNE